MTTASMCGVLLCVVGVDLCATKASTCGVLFCVSDVDECATDIAACDDNERCDNSPGSFRCNCKDGYTRKDGFCVPKGIN